MHITINLKYKTISSAPQTNIFYLNYLDKTKPQKTVTSTFKITKFNGSQCKNNNKNSRTYPKEQE